VPPHTWSAAPAGFVSDPLMVRRPGAEAEDDGWCSISSGTVHDGLPIW